MGALYTAGAALFAALLPLTVYGVYLAVHGVFPWALPLLAAGIFWMLSALQGALRFSLVWFTGMARCVLYEVLLCWQYPVAWLTWWVRRREDRA